MMRTVVLLLASLSVATALNDYIGGTDIDEKKSVYIDGKAAELRVETNEFGLDEYTEEVAQYVDDSQVDPNDKFRFLISIIDPTVVGETGDYCEPKGLDQIMLAVLRAGFMDKDVLFAGIKQEYDEHDDGNVRKLQRRRRGKYNYGGYGCRRCKKRGGGRKLADRYDEYEQGQDQYIEDDSLTDDAIAARITRALRIAIIQTFAVDPASCLFELIDKALQVDIVFG